MFSNNFPKAVLWDMDGTLIDSEPYWMLSETRLAEQYGSTWSEKDALQLIGNDLFHASDILRNQFGIEDMTTREVIDRLTDEVIEQLRTKLPWRPGALELLVELKKAGIKTALVTMSMRTMALTVADQIDFQAFDVVVAGDDVTNGKPHPEPYLRAAELLGVAPEDCLAFEDSPTGLASAEAAGCHAIGVTNIINLATGPNRRIISSLTEVTIENLAALRINNEDK
ncbi:putative phosphatase [Candidatus Aquiluna sp. IMCC13023]|uniref:HAD family hydrolase n=1 Tax=Candidatus Aquiluna sp. IMCC13023 TaxID=1081644 RepID=UPI00025B1587|nr:HAD family phosphatase [Candidatus Aquiluna sp. IMCC13023]EIC91274.1 putative phosphatase [Candidatus Aquiluna sp. IMCC13023]